MTVTAGRAVVLRGDARRLPLPDGTADLILCSPPYYKLREYTDGDGAMPGQIGAEPTPAAYLETLWACTAEWARVLKPAGSIFVNLGDKYAGSPSGPRSSPIPEAGKGNAKSFALRRDAFTAGVKPKSLLGLPWRYALGCLDQLGLILRAEIIWDKPDALPESVTDRVRRSHEQVFHFTRSPRYYSAIDEIREAYRPSTASRYRYAVQSHTPDAYTDVSRGALRDVANPLGRLPGSVWTIPSAPLAIPERLGVEHFAAYPPELCRRIILGWSPPGICLECGEGRRPVVSAVRIGAGKLWDASGRGVIDRLPRRNDEHTDRRHLGYACACPEPSAPVRPAVVVNPFAGTGTTMLAASVLGRTGIGINRSAAYCRAARWRTRDPGERARVIGAPKPPPVADGQGELFDPLEAL